VQRLCWNFVLRRGRSANRRTVTVSTPSGANNAWLATVALDVSGTASIGHQARQRTPATVDAITIQSGLVRRGDPCPFAGVCPARSGSGVWLAHVAITRAGSGAGAGRSLMTAAPPKSDQSEKSRRITWPGGSGGVGAFRHRRDCQRGKCQLLAVAAPPAPPRSWVGTEQWVKADEHDRPHVRLPVLPLALGGSVPTDVHSRSSIATSDPVAFSAQSIRLRDTPQFTLKGAVSD
jgi:hypothetical protein